MSDGNIIFVIIATYFIGVGVGFFIGYSQGGLAVHLDIYNKDMEKRLEELREEKMREIAKEILEQNNINN